MDVILHPCMIFFKMKCGLRFGRAFSGSNTKHIPFKRVFENSEFNMLIVATSNANALFLQSDPFQPLIKPLTGIQKSLQMGNIILSCVHTATLPLLMCLPMMPRGFSVEKESVYQSKIWIIYYHNHGWIGKFSIWRDLIAIQRLVACLNCLGYNEWLMRHIL